MPSFSKMSLKLLDVGIWFSVWPYMVLLSLEGHVLSRRLSCQVYGV